MGPSKPELSVWKDIVEKTNSIYNENVLIGIPDTTNETKVCELLKQLLVFQKRLTVWKLIVVYLPNKMINLSLNFQE